MIDSHHDEAINLSISAKLVEDIFVCSERAKRVDFITSNSYLSQSGVHGF